MAEYQGSLERFKLDPRQLPDVVGEKWSEDVSVLDEGFVPFPKRLLRCLPAIFPHPNAMYLLSVVLAIVDYRRPKLKRDPSIEYLAFTAGLSTTRFKQYLVDLQKMNYVTIEGPDESLRIGIRGLLEKVVRETTDEG